MLQLWICFLFHKSWCSERVCRVLATSVLQTVCFLFLSGRLFIQDILILPGHLSWRLTNVLQVEDVLNYCHSHLWVPATPRLIPFITCKGSPFDVSWLLTQSQKQRLRRNQVPWVLWRSPNPCYSLLNLSHTQHMKCLNFTPTVMQWFPPPLRHPYSTPCSAVIILLENHSIITFKTIPTAFQLQSCLALQSAPPFFLPSVSSFSSSSKVFSYLF